MVSELVEEVIDCSTVVWEVSVEEEERVVVVLLVLEGPTVMVLGF